MEKDPNAKSVNDEKMSADEFLEQLEKEGRITVRKPQTPGELLVALVNSRRFFKDTKGIKNSKDIDTILAKIHDFFSRFEKKKQDEE